MSADSVWAFEYAGLPDEGGTEPPHILIDLEGPRARLPYPCLLDSGASFSALPLEAADELGIDRALLEETEIRFARGQAEVLHLRRTDLVFVCWDEQRVPIAPYFFPPEVIEDEEFEADYYILGRDFFLAVEVTFRQAARQAVLRST